MDTEADNLYHYRTRLCLLQLRVADEIFLVSLDAVFGHGAPQRLGRPRAPTALSGVLTPRTVDSTYPRGQGAPPGGCQQCLTFSFGYPRGRVSATFCA